MTRRDCESGRSTGAISSISRSLRSRRPSRQRQRSHRSCDVAHLGTVERTLATLVREMAMSESADRSRGIPKAWHSVTPRIVVHDAPQCVAFIKQVFAATGEYRADIPAILTIGDSIV